MRILVLSVLLLSLSACSWFGGDDEIDLSAPAELIEFNPTLSVKKAWQVNIGSGNSKQGINLVPAIDGELIYAADYKGNVLAVDAGTGRTQWRIDTELKSAGRESPVCFIQPTSAPRSKASSSANLESPTRLLTSPGSS